VCINLRETQKRRKEAQRGEWGQDKTQGLNSEKVKARRKATQTGNSKTGRDKIDEAPIRI